MVADSRELGKGGATIIHGGRLLSRYRTMLSVLAVVILFMYAPGFAWAGAFVSYPPLYFDLALALATTPLLLGGGIRQLVMSPVSIWAWIYSVMLVVWYLFTAQVSSPEAYQVLQTYALGLGTLLLVYLIHTDRSALRAGRLALAAAVMIAVLLNLYEVLHPGTFSIIPGRAAGMYMSPTISGPALIGGLVLTVHLFGGWKKLVYVLFVGAAVLATLSRAAIAGWLLVCLLLLIQRRGSAKRVKAVAAAVALGLGVAVFLVPTWDWEEASLSLPADVRTSIPRLGVGIAYPVTDELSAWERLESARAAWRLFGEHPISGAGVGATITWGRRVSTHNMYLTHMAEFGILGFFLLPGLVWALVWRTSFPERQTLFLFGVYFLFASIFSHNVLEQWTFVYLIGMGAALSRQSHSSGGREAEP